MQRHPIRPHLFMTLAASVKCMPQLEDAEAEAQILESEYEYSQRFVQSEDFEPRSGHTPSTRPNDSQIQMQFQAPKPLTARVPIASESTPGRLSPPAIALDASCSYSSSPSASPSGPPAKRARVPAVEREHECESNAALRALLEREKAAATSVSTASAAQVAVSPLGASSSPGGQTSPVPATGAGAPPPPPAASSDELDPTTAELIAAFVNSEPDAE